MFMRRASGHLRLFLFLFPSRCVGAGVFAKQVGTMLECVLGMVML